MLLHLALQCVYTLLFRPVIWQNNGQLAGSEIFALCAQAFQHPDLFHSPDTSPTTL
jgi:hypothetical protein